MDCSHCQGAEKTFNSRMAQRELRKYRSKGPGKTTRLLVEAIKSANIEGTTMLDIGGGVGAIENELLDDGVRSAIDVDASSAYLALKGASNCCAFPLSTMSVYLS